MDKARLILAHLKSTQTDSSFLLLILYTLIFVEPPVKPAEKDTVFGWNMGDAAVPPFADNSRSVELNEQYKEVCAKDPESCDYKADATKPLV